MLIVETTDKQDGSKSEFGPFGSREVAEALVQSLAGHGTYSSVKIREEDGE